jgi:hypothetical protein
MLSYYEYLWGCVQAGAFFIMLLLVTWMDLKHKTPYFYRAVFLQFVIFAVYTLIAAFLIQKLSISQIKSGGGEVAIFYLIEFAIFTGIHLLVFWIWLYFRNRAPTP